MPNGNNGSPPNHHRKPARPGIPGLDTAAIGAPITRLGASFFPIYLPGADLPDIVTGAEAKCTLDELDEASVATLAIHNHGDTPALLVEGEHFLGGKQNRMVNVTVLVPAATTLEIPVSCLEEGRWGRRTEYRRARSFAPARMRARHRREVHHSMSARGSRRGNQGAIWDEAASALHRHAAPSPTHSVAAAEAVHDRDSRRAAALRDLVRRGPLPGQCGIVVACGKWIQAIDLFGAPGLLKAHWSGLVRSHLLDLERPHGRPSASRALRSLQRFARLRTRGTDGVGMGIELRGQSHRISGQALVLDQGLVHATAFMYPPPLVDPAPPVR